MKMIKFVFNLTVAGMAAMALWLSFYPTGRQIEIASGVSNRGDVEEVVYMSDIDGLVKAVMLYGVTNGITYNGTNYMFVVEPKED